MVCWMSPVCCRPTGVSFLNGFSGVPNIGGASITSLLLLIALLRRNRARREAELLGSSISMNPEIRTSNVFHFPYSETSSHNFADEDNPFAIGALGADGEAEYPPESPITRAPRGGRGRGGGVGRRGGRGGKVNFGKFKYSGRSRKGSRGASSHKSGNYGVDMSSVRTVPALPGTTRLMPMPSWKPG